MWTKLDKNEDINVSCSPSKEDRPTLNIKNVDGTLIVKIWRDGGLCTTLNIDLLSGAK